MPTIENRGNENSGEVGCSFKVQVVRDLWSIRIVGPGLFLRVRHDSDVCEGGMVLVGRGTELKVGGY